MTFVLVLDVSFVGAPDVTGLQHSPIPDDLVNLDYSSHNHTDHPACTEVNYSASPKNVSYKVCTV